MKTVVAIGVFDGVHIGHKKILKNAVNLARRNHAKSIALTFYPHPLSVINSKSAPLSLISLKHRINLIKSSGIDECVVFNFTKTFAQSPADKFIKDILLKKLNAGWVVVGEDFCFGRRRSGDSGLLAKKGAEYGFKVKRVGILKYKGIPVSSSLIRQAIQSGRLSLAECFLDRPVAVLGTVVKGRGVGRKLGFPTANVNPHHEIVPPGGVYAAQVILWVDKNTRKQYNAIVNIGIRPTFYGLRQQDKEPAIEVYLFDFNKSIYGRDVEIVFIKKMRSEKRFKTKEMLITQIKKDVKKAKRLTGKIERYYAF